MLYPTELRARVVFFSGNSHVSICEILRPTIVAPTENTKKSKASEEVDLHLPKRFHTV